MLVLDHFKLDLNVNLTSDPYRMRYRNGTPLWNGVFDRDSQLCYIAEDTRKGQNGDFRSQDLRHRKCGGMLLSDTPQYLYDVYTLRYQQLDSTRIHQTVKS